MYQGKGEIHLKFVDHVHKLLWNGGSSHVMVDDGVGLSALAERRSHFAERYATKAHEAGAKVERTGLCRRSEGGLLEGWKGRGRSDLGGEALLMGSLRSECAGLHLLRSGSLESVCCASCCFSGVDGCGFVAVLFTGGGS